MRILHIITTLSPQAGGPPQSVGRIVSSYATIGSEGEVLTLDDPAAPFLRHLSFEVHALGLVSTRYGYTPRLVPWLLANRDRFDGVVLHGLWQYPGFSVRHTLRGHKPYLVFPHGMLDPHFRKLHHPKYFKKLAYWLVNEYRLLRDAHRVLFTSEAEAAKAQHSFWPHRWHPFVVPYGAVAPTAEPVAFTRIFLDQHPRLRRSDGSARPFLLFLGRIHKKKGCDLLIEAFAKIADRAPELHLVFAGPDESPQGTLTKTLVATAKHLGVDHRIHWTGMLEGDQKWGAFHACQAFCLPSHQENFGIAVAEALACGKPVLLSNQVDIWREIVHDGAAFAGNDTVAGTLHTLERWLALSPEQKLAMGERALACFQRRYDMRDCISGILDAFAPQTDHHPDQIRERNRHPPRIHPSTR